MELPIITYQGKKTKRTITLSDHIFGIQPNKHAVYLAIKLLRNNQRQGTHKTKQKSEVNYSTRKIQKQKGTGNARKGSRKSNILRGGANTFGPTPRNYSFKLNKKQKKLAIRSALSYKAQNNHITILADFNFEEPKTKAYWQMLKDLSMQKEKTLLVLAAPNKNKNIILASRNLPKTQIITVDKLSTYPLIDATKLLVPEDAIPLIEKKLA